MVDPHFPPIPHEQRALSPTDIARYNAQAQCRRFLRLRMYRDRDVERQFQAYGVQIEPLSPLLGDAGRQFEQQVAAQIARSLPLPPLLFAQDQINRPPDTQAFVAALAALAPLQRRLLVQPRLTVQAHGWQLTGDLDLVIAAADADGRLQLTVIDSKYSAAARLEHRLQVAFSVLMLQSLAAQRQLQLASITPAVLYRGPAADDPSAGTVDQQRRAVERAAAQAIGVTDGYLHIVPPQDVPQLLRSAGDLLTEHADPSAAQAFAELPFHVARHCDGCRYSQFCLKWIAEHDDLSLVPTLSAVQKQTLQQAGITTSLALATLRDLPPGSSELQTPPEQRAVMRALISQRSINTHLDHLIHRARAYQRRERRVDLTALERTPYHRQPSLPACSSELHPNLVRIYLDAQYDYLLDRVYLLSALVVAAEHGRLSPKRRRTVVRFSRQPLRDGLHEQQLLIDFVRSVLQALAAVAAPDRDGLRRAPLHLILYDDDAQQTLLAALMRHFSALAAAAALDDLTVGEAGFAGPHVTLVAKERRQQFHDPLLAESLHSLARQLGFDWQGHDRRFYRGIFDDRRQDAATAAWYSGRARFSSRLPLEYAYAYWQAHGTAAAPEIPLAAAYGGIALDELTAFAARRLAALEAITATLAVDVRTQRPTFALDVPAGGRVQAPTVAAALRGFVLQERHSELAAWISAHLAPPSQRVIAGESLSVRFDPIAHHAAVAAVRAENARRQQLYAQLTADLIRRNPQRTSLHSSDLSTEQQAAVARLPEPPLTLSVVSAHADLDVAQQLALSRLSVGDYVVIAPRLSADSRLPPDQQVPFTTTYRQLQTAPRAEIRAIHQDGTLTIEPRRRSARGDGIFSFSAAPWQELHALTDYTVEPDPNNIYLGQQYRAVQSDERLAANSVYRRLTEPLPAVQMTQRERSALARFTLGLQTLAAAAVPLSFDEAQRAYIVEHAAEPLLLVQGPPGTGKSFTSAFALLARLQAAAAAGRSCRIAVSCKTHAATRVLLAQFVAVQRLLREHIARLPAPQAALFDELIVRAPAFRFAARGSEAVIAGVVYVATDDPAGMADHLAKAPLCVVAATPTALQRIADSAAPQFDWLVLDEASQLNLPEAIMAATGLQRDGRLIIVGDHRQMPPIVMHDWTAEQRRLFQAYPVYRSLFETLPALQPLPPTVRLARSFRVHRDIAEFLRRAIYAQDGIPFYSQRDQILAAADHRQDWINAALTPQHALVVIVHDEMSSQVRNTFEAALTQQLVNAVVAAYWPADAAQARELIGVVVPHRAQRALVSNGLTQRPPQPVALVDTVERFQGDERQVIIVSATESDPAYLRDSAAFLLDARRLNVAVSRARQKVILIASRSVFTAFVRDEATYAHARVWRELLYDVCREMLWQGALLHTDPALPAAAHYRVQIFGNRRDLLSDTSTALPVP